MHLSVLPTHRSIARPGLVYTDPSFVPELYPYWGFDGGIYGIVLAAGVRARVRRRV